MAVIWIGSGRFGIINPAQAYITAVEAADGQALEQGVKDAITDFVTGCQEDGIWSAIKACCIMAGARTLAGALVPLVGAAPTNVGFVAGDYNRKTGLKGDGISKYLVTGVTLNDVSNDNFSLAANITEPHTAGSAGWVSAQTGNTAVYLGRYNGGLQDGVQAGTEVTRAAYTGTSRAGFHGGVGTSLSSRSYFYSGSTVATNTATVAKITGATQYTVFRTAVSVSGQISNPRMSFYSIGLGLDLQLLNNRVTALANAIAAAIP
jgi:hypothetical protein